MILNIKDQNGKIIFKIFTAEKNEVSDFLSSDFTDVNYAKNQRELEFQNKLTKAKDGDSIKMTGNKIEDSGQRSEFITGAVRDCQNGKGRMDLLPVRAIFALAKHFENGCEKYGDRNWEKGIPLSRYMDSGLRHAMKFLRGDRDEPHLEAAIWNLTCLFDTQERIKEGMLPVGLNDLPNNPISTDKCSNCEDCDENCERTIHKNRGS